MNSESRGFEIRLRNIHQLIQDYKANVPFSKFLKQAFHANRNFGSSDRRFYSAWCYAWFRLGNALADIPPDSRLLAARYLVHGSAGDFFLLLADRCGIRHESFFESSTVSERAEQLANLFPGFRIRDITGFDLDLSGDLTHDTFALSLLIQPPVWIRVTPGKMRTVTEALKQSGIGFEQNNETVDALKLDPQVKLDLVPPSARKFIQVQDRASQMAGSAVPVLPGERWWDCCCGSGGKSLQLLDREPSLKITATDIRQSILENFQKRFSSSNKAMPTVVDMDLVNPESITFPDSSFDGILADVPCTGSGTWARTPEQVARFTNSELEKFRTRQEQILGNIRRCIRPGGKLVYMTCSVFRKENEEMARFIEQEPGFKMDEMKFINGIENNSDSMFYAIFSKV